MGYLLPTASIVELIQMVLALIGVGLAFWKLWIAIENGLVITHTESTDLRRVVAETQVLGELFRLFQQGCLVAMGVISVLLPPPHPGITESPAESLQSALIRFGLISLSSVMVADSVVQEYRRRSFLVQVHDLGGGRTRPATLEPEKLDTIPVD